MRVARPFWPLVVLACACSKPDPTTTTEKTEKKPAVSTADAAAAAPAAPSGPPPRTYTASAVAKKGSRITRCDDVTVVVRDTSDVSEKGKPTKDPARGFLTTFAPDFAPATTKCDASRALATCTIADFKPDTDEPTFTWVLHHHDVAALERDDAVMNACQHAGGTWKALPRDSEEWKRARLENAAPPTTKPANPLTIDIR